MGFSALQQLYSNRYLGKQLIDLLPACIVKCIDIVHWTVDSASGGRVKQPEDSASVHCRRAAILVPVIIDLVGNI